MNEVKPSPRVDEMMVEGEKAAVRHRFRGTQRGSLGPYPPTGKVMESEYIAIYLVRGGQVIEAWAEWDNLAGLRQLGHIQAFADCGETRSENVRCSSTAFAPLESGAPTGR
jgi:hypothetical protein